MSERLNDKRIAELTVFGGHIGCNRESAAELRAMASELRERRGADLTHAQNSCLDCEGPLAPCDCQPNCPGARCARRCHETQPRLSAEDVKHLRHLRAVLGDVLIEWFPGRPECLSVLDRIINGGGR